ncbi:MAG: MarC family protein [Syntrophales bacterium]|nr:MarC family protein [Syntrophales bacterium]
MTAADIKTYLDCLFAFLALINPISKIFIMTSLSDRFDFKALRGVAVKASMVSVIILIGFVFLGDILLRNVFHVQIYAFKIAGGLVLVLRGFDALNKGVFFEFDENTDTADVSIVPLASPMIAGPATISASLSFPVNYGVLTTTAAIIGALLINLFVMLYSRAIGKFLIRCHIMGALIRITGLIVATIGIQMILDGFSDYLAA